MCAKTSGACVADGIVMIALGFCRGQEFPECGETGLDIVCGCVVWSDYIGCGSGL